MIIYFSPPASKFPNTFLACDSPVSTFGHIDPDRYTCGVDLADPESQTLRIAYTFSSISLHGLYLECQKAR